MGQEVSSMRFQFKIRDLGLVTVITALILGWLVDHKRLTDKIAQISELVQPASMIEGRVTYLESGEPATGIRIRAQVANRANVGDLQGRATYGVAKTDDDGHYKFVNLAPASWNIFVEADGWTASAIDALAVVADQEVKNADLQLVNGGFIEGQVVNIAGKPVSRAEGQRITIGVYGPARPKSGPAIEAVYVDAQGKFRIRVPSGRNYPYISSVMPQSVLSGQEFQKDGVTVSDGKATQIQFRIESSDEVRTGTLWPPSQPKESEPSDE